MSEPPITAQEAFDNAARILRQAEMLTDRDLMEKMTGIADSWTMLGEKVHELTRNG